MKIEILTSKERAKILIENLMFCTATATPTKTDANFMTVEIEFKGTDESYVYQSIFHAGIITGTKEALSQIK